jgi:hypothetical protein
MALKKKTTTPAPRQAAPPKPTAPSNPTPEGGRADRLPFLRTEEIDENGVNFLMGAVREMKTQYGRSIVIDGLADGEPRTWTIRVDSSTLAHLIGAVVKGVSVKLKTIPFRNREGNESRYIDLA